MEEDTDFVYSDVFPADSFASVEVLSSSVLESFILSRQSSFQKALDKLGEVEKEASQLREQIALLNKKVSWIPYLFPSKRSI